MRRHRDAGDGNVIEDRTTARAWSSARHGRWASLLLLLTGLGIVLGFQPASAAPPMNAEAAATLGFPRQANGDAYTWALGGDGGLFFPAWRRLSVGGSLAYLRYSEKRYGTFDVSLLSLGPCLRVLLTGGPSSRLSTYCSFSYVLHTRTITFPRRCCVLRSPEDDTFFGPSAALSSTCQIGATPVSLLSTLRYIGSNGDPRGLSLFALSLGLSYDFRSTGW
jgi:hypothetical protein